MNDNKVPLTETSNALMAEAFKAAIGIMRTMAKDPDITLLNGPDALEIVANAIEAGAKARFGS
jgi:hypothetical protein